LTSLDMNLKNAGLSVSTVGRTAGASSARRRAPWTACADCDRDPSTRRWAGRRRRRGSRRARSPAPRARTRR